MITLKCHTPISAHWGEILIVGLEYTGEIITKEASVITDYDNYWKYTSMVSQSITWIRKGYDESNLHEVMPGYIKLSEISRLYSKKIEMPFVNVKCSDGGVKDFCLLTDSELYRLGASKGKEGKSLGKPCFCYSVNRVDDYFDYSAIRRDRKLSDLGI